MPGASKDRLRRIVVLAGSVLLTFENLEACVQWEKLIDSVAVTGHRKLVWKRQKIEVY